MRWFLFSLFALGLLIAVFGWFFDRAANFSFLLKRIAPDYVHGINALGILAYNNKRALTSRHRGFIVLLSRWPDHPLISSVAFIGRSVAYMEFGPRVKNDFQLILRDAQQNEINPSWSEANARNSLENELNRKLFTIGTIIFFTGISVSFVSGLLEFLKNRS
jgi:uncharacterized BrkB/YihY/UPF0761 family membrane protein